MKIFKKIIGYIIIIAFALLVIGSVIYNIMSAGWYFVLAMIIGVAVVPLVIWGLHLLSDNE